MKFDDLETKMRRYECYHEQTVLYENWFVVRLDGRGFSKLTKKHFAKPFDEKLSSLMAGVTSGLVSEYQAEYAYTESDEISLLFRPSWNMYERRVEKIISLMASTATSIFVSTSGIRAQFDARVVVLPTHPVLVDYFRWREEDAARNALNTFAFWTFVNSGLSEAKATRELERCGFKDKLNKLFDRKIDFFAVPTKYRNGLGFVWEYYTKEGFNPKTQTIVHTPRRRVATVDPLPTGDNYANYIRGILVAAEAPPLKIEEGSVPVPVPVKDPV